MSKRPRKSPNVSRVAARRGLATARARADIPQTVVPRSTATEPDTATIELTVYDGTRSPIDPGVELLVRILDGTQKQLHSGFQHGPRIAFIVPFSDNMADRYTMLVSADHYRQAGFTPLVVHGGERRAVDLMLLPKPFRFEFKAWADLPIAFAGPLGAGVTPPQAEARYTGVMRDKPPSLAAVLNILTASSAIILGHGTVLDYFKQLIWDESMAQDRFFAFADAELVREVKEATAQGEFVSEPSPGILHPGATSSFKQVQFGEANVQLTFHEGVTQTIGGTACVKMEPDIDYYKDAVGHALLEVVPGMIGGQLTDPATVYVLRWIAGRFAGVPEFNPPFTIVPSAA
jgi:hypothetical protein